MEGGGRFGPFFYGLVSCFVSRDVDMARGLMDLYCAPVSLWMISTGWPGIGKLSEVLEDCL
jgi:hypothetical protein